MGVCNGYLPILLVFLLLVVDAPAVSPLLQQVLISRWWGSYYWRRPLRLHLRRLLIILLHPPRHPLLLPGRNPGSRFCSGAWPKVALHPLPALPRRATIDQSELATPNFEAVVSTCTDFFVMIIIWSFPPRRRVWLRRMLVSASFRILYNIYL